MSATDVALHHYRSRAELVEAVGAAASRRWTTAVVPNGIGRSWSRAIPGLLVVLGGAQLVAARQADAYLTEVLGEQAMSAAAVAEVVPEQLAGIASDGRPLFTLLNSPVVASVAALDAGASAARALAAGLAVLDMIVRTQVADAGRAADAVSLVAHPTASGYVRMTVGKTCARCAILAGRWYRWSTGFKRHPRCDCVMIPSQESRSDDIRLDPQRLLDSGQVAGLSKAKREAVDLGGDFAQVVNADRGMYTADGRKFTTESTTRRGSGPRIRLMPGQIIEEANGDRAEAIRLLRFHGYIR